jgi:hypothetical protein
VIPRQPLTTIAVINHCRITKSHSMRISPAGSFSGGLRGWNSMVSCHKVIRKLFCTVQHHSADSFILPPPVRKMQDTEEPKDGYACTVGKEYYMPDLIMVSLPDHYYTGITRKNEGRAV